jgi:hypothetical protein
LPPSTAQAACNLNLGGAFEQLDEDLKGLLLHADQDPTLAEFSGAELGLKNAQSK